MAKHTPSIAKNQMRRCLRAIMNPLPTDTEVASLWEFFECQCAYCGDKLSREDRSGQLDHVEPQSKGGTNSVFNHVLSCGKCNGDDKREMPWEAFLEQREPNVVARENRRLRIKTWLEKQVIKNLYSADVEKEIETIEAAAMQSFDAYVQSMRDLRERSVQGA